MRCLRRLVEFSATHEATLPPQSLGITERRASAALGFCASANGLSVLAAATSHSDAAGDCRGAIICKTRRSPEHPHDAATTKCPGASATDTTAVATRRGITFSDTINLAASRAATVKRCCRGRCAHLVGDSPSHYLSARVGPFDSILFGTLLLPPLRRTQPGPLSRCYLAAVPCGQLRCGGNDGRCSCRITRLERDLFNHELNCMFPQCGHSIALHAVPHGMTPH
jgi:hypothetical protein